MAQSIEELLHRRTDLSTFLVHFTRGGTSLLARENIVNILRTGYIEARNPFGMGRKVALEDSRFASGKASLDSQNVICFSETPLEHAWMMCGEIEGRESGPEPYGIAFTKSWARGKGVNPVWYLDMTPGHDWLTKPIDKLRDDAVAQAAASGESLSEFSITKVLPFFEQMGPTLTGRRKEWWWEREWRHVGHLGFDWSEVVAILAPVDEHDGIRNEITAGFKVDYLPPPLLDPTWGLERMISALRGIPEHMSGPFPKP